MKELYKGLGHIAIYTADMEESIAFYEKIGGSVYKRDGVHTPEGEKKLALVEFAGFSCRRVRAASHTLPFTWTTWTRQRRHSRPRALSRS